MLIGFAVLLLAVQFEREVYELPSGAVQISRLTPAECKLREAARTQRYSESHYEPRVCPPPARGAYLFAPRTTIDQPAQPIPYHGGGALSPAGDEVVANPAPLPPPVLDPRCAEEQVTESIARSAAMEEYISWKSKFHYLPNPIEQTKILNRHRQQSAASFITALGKLGTKTPTYALVYGEGTSRSQSNLDAGERCVFLFTSAGLVASATWIENGSALPNAWAALLVSAGSARTGKREDGCEVVNQPVVEGPSADEKMAALARVTAQVLPPPILLAISSLPPGRLLIDPSAELRAFPFAALPLERGHLIDRFSILMTPGPAAIMWGASKTRSVGVTSQSLGSTEALIVGDPDLSSDAGCWTPLPDARDEARYAAQVSGATEVLLGADATFAAVQRRLSQRSSSIRLIWFATHGTADQENPADNGFLALKGRHLRGADLRDRSFPRKPLVIMSACESGLGKTFADGIFGMADLWRFAGASQVVMSGWRVNDSGTKKLMANFAIAAKRQGWQGAEYALADAMRELKRTNPDPAIWAAFNVYGEPSP
jgi:hypothetical protein